MEHCGERLRNGLDCWEGSLQGERWAGGALRDLVVKERQRGPRRIPASCKTGTVWWQDPLPRLPSWAARQRRPQSRLFNHLGGNRVTERLHAAITNHRSLSEEHGKWKSKHFRRSQFPPFKKKKREKKYNVMTLNSIKYPQKHVAIFFNESKVH